MKILAATGLALLVLAGCSGDGDRSSHPTAANPISVNCKSPITNQPVPLTQWRRDAETWRREKVALAQSVNTTVTTVKVECGDEVVFAPEPVPVPQPS